MENDRRVLSTEEALYRAGVAIIPVGILLGYVALRWIIPNLPDAECTVHMLFGVYCPGCGGTRAVIALLHGQFLKSVWYHPFVMYTILIYMWFMISHTLEKLHVPLIKGMLFRTWMLYGMLFMIGFNFVFKNVLKFCFGIET